MTDAGSGYLVIGATAAPGSDELPQFLDPVCQAPDQDQTLFVANVEPWDGSPPGLHAIARQTFDEECDSGYWQRLVPGFTFDWGYHLVALDADRPPVYLPAPDAAQVVQGRGERQLEAVAADLARGVVRETSDERLWYAARALPDDPFPLLALLAMERGRLSQTLLAEFESELPEHYPHPSPLHRRALDLQWTALLRLIADDPVGGAFLAVAESPKVLSADWPADSAASASSGSTTAVRRRSNPSWLGPFTNVRGFLPTMQQQFGAA